ncbi:MAG TPA: type II toxin-antitoxin system VapC family toxin [Thermoanaerobaculia bacterium]|nr:type II toxin-antitoxin system VapC family toxin [Thermoanaerobaculia bacterium]
MPPTAERALLLDTHAFLWAATDPSRLGAAARAAIEDGDIRLLLSTASVWEMAIKASLGKLDLAGPVSELVGEQIVRLRVDLLPVEVAHACATSRRSKGSR